VHAVADTIQQVADVAGAAVERLGGKVVGGIVERGIHFLTGREAALRGGEQIGGRLQ
jgi:actin-like ATPase involved in cell morphogenesis